MLIPEKSVLIKEYVIALQGSVYALQITMALHVKELYVLITVIWPVYAFLKLNSLLMPVVFTPHPGMPRKNLDVSAILAEGGPIVLSVSHYHPFFLLIYVNRVFK
jgi:hypothetical protein